MLVLLLYSIKSLYFLFLQDHTLGVCFVSCAVAVPFHIFVPGMFLCPCALPASFCSVKLSFQGFFWVTLFYSTSTAVARTSMIQYVTGTTLYQVVVIFSRLSCFRCVLS